MNKAFFAVWMLPNLQRQDRHRGEDECDDFGKTHNFKK